MVEADRPDAAPGNLKGPDEPVAADSDTAPVEEVPSPDEVTAAAESGETGGTATVGINSGQVREASLPDAPVMFRTMENEKVTVLDSEDERLRVGISTGLNDWTQRSLFEDQSPPAQLVDRVEAGDSQTASHDGWQPEQAESEQPPDGSETQRSTSVQQQLQTAQEPGDGASEEVLAEAQTTTETEAKQVPDAPEGTKADADSSTNQVLTVAVDSGRMRNAPSLEAPVLFSVEKDQQFRVLRQQGEWYQLTTGSGPAGWAHQSLFGQPQTLSSGVELDAATTPESGKHRTLTVGVVVGLVREAPSESAPVQFRLYRNEKVTALEVRDEWIRIRRVNGWTGWTHESLFLPGGSPEGEALIEPNDVSGETATVAVDVGLVREAPSPEAAKVCRVVAKMKVEIMSRQEDWLQIRMTNGWTGWAHKSLFEVADDATVQ